MYAFVIVMKVSSNSNFETRVIHFSCFEICVLFQSQSKYFLFIQSRLKVHFFSLIESKNHVQSFVLVGFRDFSYLIFNP
jgi:hypothetical protein